MKQRSYIVRGLTDAIPVTISFLFVFSSIGVLYHNKGLSLTETTLGTILLFAAPLQISAADLILREQHLAALAMTLLVNFRFFFMSMAASQYFSGVKKIKVLLSLLFFSVSTHAVSHSYFESAKLRDGKSQFLYYLAVSIPSYSVAVIATALGFLLASYLNYSSIELFIAMILPIHFTALIARNSGKGLALLATASGVFSAPFLTGNTSQWLVVTLPVLAGILIARMESVARNGRLR